MLELIAIALFQFASFTHATAAPTLSQPTSEPTSEIGIGGWGHDRAAVGSTQPTGSGVTPNAEIGIGGWGHD